MSFITPINDTVQQRVVQEVARYIALAEAKYNIQIALIDVLFDLKGRAAGMYRVKRVAHSERGYIPLLMPSRARRKAVVERRIRFNPWLFAKYPEDSWHNTIPHEVAHYVTDCVFGLSSIRPHGKQWQQVMLDFGAEPKIYADYSLDGVPTRKVRRYPYRCQCRDVELSGYRHKKITTGQQRYRCRDCASELVLIQ